MPRPRKPATPGVAPPRPRANAQTQWPFPAKLALNQWLLSLFHVTKLEDLADHLRGDGLEGLDENNIHRFHHALTANLFNLSELPVDLLLEYDQNIFRHSQQLNDRRLTRGEAPVVWKYFQYLALLFTEIYLDRYFTDPAALRVALNAQIAKQNDGKPPADQVTPLDESVDAWPQLNKLSFWMATGSGKTLLMHANILQYRFYLAKHGRTGELNRTLLLTPNDGLSRQHLEEFNAAGLYAELFDKDARGGLFAEDRVEIIEVTRLVDEEAEKARAIGVKSVAVGSFEGNNLVLVDEGHRGTSGGEDGAWLKARNALCERGFSFEYSATFQQAVAGKPRLTDLYAKNILFNYSYRYFYDDGFGKDYQILNLDDDTQSAHLELYLVAGLLSFFQQLRLFQKESAAFRPFHIEKPLWIFVGGSVTKTLASRDATDIVEILKFLSRYTTNATESARLIGQALNEGLVTDQGKNLFAGRFAYLNTCGLTPADVYRETLAAVFNAPAGGRLTVENIKGAAGEIALRLGASEQPFGVINVGEDAKLLKLCEEAGLATAEPEFAAPLFRDINKPASAVNVLIGSKKFTEGWSSWRVATMGLMNVGRGEGAQIIQLFGRGVRLKGHGVSLKRSGKLRLPEGVERPRHIAILETLGIFGIRADYMAGFRDFLREEGVPDNQDRVEFLMPVIRNLGTQRLRMIRLKKTINGVSTEFGDAFRRLGPVPTMQPPDGGSEYLRKNQVVLNWYPKISREHSPGLLGGDAAVKLNETHLSAGHVAFMNVDRLWFELERHKAERGWHNFNLTRTAVAKLLADQSWYTLQIPATEMAFDDFGRVVLWEEIALALLKEYAKRYYTFRKREWELPHLEYQDLAPNDPNLLGVGDTPGDPYYRILIDESREEVVAKLEELRAAIETGNMRPWEFRGLTALWFGRHAYQPLLSLRDGLVEITPAPLNKGERQFVEDLKAFHEADGGFLAGKDLYLLRNLSKGRGVGFFEAGNFHPDFILWLQVGETQHIIFADPKGIRNVGSSDPKIQFYRTVKEIETELGDPAVRLNSFIISNTPSWTMELLWGMDKSAMTARHILFQEEDKSTYIRQLFSLALAPRGQQQNAS